MFIMNQKILILLKSTQKILGKMGILCCCFHFLRKKCKDSYAKKQTNKQTKPNQINKTKQNNTIQNKSAVSQTSRVAFISETNITELPTGSESSGSSSGLPCSMQLSGNLVRSVVLT